MAKIGTGNAPDGGSGMESDTGTGVIADARDGGVIDVVDPANLSSGSGDGNASGNSGEPGKRRRGRPAGSGNGNRSKPTAAETKTAVSGIEPLLLSIHKGLAGLLKSPEFELEPDEAKKLSESMVLVASQYSVEVNPKYMAWIALVGCLIGIYGPRIGAAAIRRNTKKNPQRVASNDEQQQTPGMLRPVPVAPFNPPQSFTG